MSDDLLGDHPKQVRWGISAISESLLVHYPVQLGIPATVGSKEPQALLQSVTPFNLEFRGRNPRNRRKGLEWGRTKIETT